MRFEIKEYDKIDPLPRIVYMIIDTQHDILIDSYDSLTDAEAHNNALERCDVLNCIFGDVV